MSFTHTLSAPSGTTTTEYSTATTSTILPSPRKPERLTPETSQTAIAFKQRRARQEFTTKDQSLRNKITECRRGTSHSSAELYRWTFTQASVAPVRVKHVFEMDYNGNDQYEFYWMGRVPCRSVKVIGIVVGVTEYDDNTRYTLDDGTAVIDCDFKHPKQSKQPLTPKSKRAKPVSKYAPPEGAKAKATVLTRPNTPKISIGTILSVQGRVFQGRGSRYLRLETGSFSICSSANDEPRHWLEVLRLCREYYYLPEPFVIPKVEQQPDASTGPSTARSTTVVPSSPIAPSSPLGTECSHPSPSSSRRPRLRHPSCLHPRDLTDVTFRIYLKHYLDFAPPYRPTRAHQRGAEHVYRCETPTSMSRHKSQSDPFETPRPQRAKTQTARQKEEPEEEDDQFGFTLSYLRRVPILAEMARGVVHTEGKRREKEKRKREKEKEKEKTTKSSHNPSSATAFSSKRGTNSALDPALVRKNMKRLFQKTIRDLYKDGNIVIWDGPTRPWEDAYYADEDSIGEPSSLWKNSSKGACLSCTASTAPGSTSHVSAEEDVTANLSDADENEEAYLPVTPQTIAAPVMRALRTITGIDSQNLTRAGSRRRRAPPSVEELTLVLQRSDTRWANLGSWDVKAALEWMESEDGVFKAGDGRWAVCS